MRGGLAKGSLLLLGLALGLGLGELLVRLTASSPEIAHLPAAGYRLSPNPRIGYEPLPGGAPGLHGPTNSLGFRDREHDPRKAPGVRRVLVLGDSVAAGLRVERYADTFPALLESRLGAAGLPVEVLNFGVNGYNTMQEVALLEDRGLAFEPDVVLLAYCLNDVERSDGGILDALLDAGAGRSLARRLDRLFSASHLYRLVRYRPAPGDGGKAPPRGEYEGLYRNTVLESFDRLERLGREHGFRTLVVVFPYLRDLERYRPEHLLLHRYVRDYAQRKGFEFLDLLPALRACAARGPVAYDTLHPNEAGHRCAADAIAARWPVGGPAGAGAAGRR